MNELKQEQLIINIRDNLDRSVEELTPDLQTRLNQIRSKALQRTHCDNAAEGNLEPLVLASQVALDESEEAISTETLRRLDQIRSAAINNAQAVAPSTGTSVIERLCEFIERHRFAFPASAFATLCVLITVITLAFQLPAPSGISPGDEDIMLFASTDEIELFENLEFYQWLASNGLAD